WFSISVSKSAMPARSSVVATGTRRTLAALRVRFHSVTGPSPVRRQIVSATLRCDTRSVHEDDLRLLETVGSRLEFANGKVLIERGQPGIGLCVVAKGHVVVEAPEGTRELGPGCVVGERALLSADGQR